MDIVSEWRGLKDIDLRGRRLRVFGRYEEALETNPDVVIIANPTSLHARCAELAVTQGCHVYVEKPLAHSGKTAAAVVRLAASRGVVVAVGCQLRFNACLGYVKTCLEQQRCGRLLYVHVNSGEYLPNYHPKEDYRRSYAARAELGGGILLTQIHDLNYLHWIFGKFEAVSAVGGKTSDLELDVEDNVSVLLRTPSGLAIAAHLDFLQRPRRRSLTILGEEASLVWDYERHMVECVDADGRSQQWAPEGGLNRNQLFVDAMTDFLACVHEGKSPRTSAVDGVADVCLVDAIRRALTRGRLEAVEYDECGLESVQA